MNEHPGRHPFTTAGPYDTVAYGAALLDQNARFGALFDGMNWATPVPTCPGWTMLQLFRHLGRGDRWAAQIIRDRAGADLDPRLVRNGKPPDDIDGAITWLHDSATDLLDAVTDIGPDTEVATFLGPRPARFWLRRRLHEATVHRADADIAVGRAPTLGSELAIDGIDEWIDRLLVEQRTAERPALPEGRTLALHASATTDPRDWMLRGNQHGLELIPLESHAAQAPDTVVVAPADQLFLTMVRRLPPEAISLHIGGDPRIWRRWLDYTPL
jgi:uncharacterized protein (TIGR03083 family)